MFHLSINGRPLCVHTNCLAGAEDRRKVRGEPTCGQGTLRGAQEGALAWIEAHPHHLVAVVFGECPELAAAD